MRTIRARKGTHMPGREAYVRMLAGQDTAGEKEGYQAEYLCRAEEARGRGEGSPGLGKQGTGVKAHQGWGGKG